MNSIESLVLFFFNKLDIFSFYLEYLVHLHLMAIDMVGFNSTVLIHFQTDTTLTVICFISS